MARGPSRRAKDPAKSAQRRLERELDALTRRLVVELRDRNTCQRCGATAQTHKIDWSHVVTRGAKSVRWVEWNSKALCAGCHRWWASHPIEAADWWRAKWPERYVSLMAWRHDRKHPKINRTLIRLYLLQEVSSVANQR
jgi:5-methylcytosine-specific restriction endonuclease McrA